MARKMPKAGKPARTTAAKQPPRVAGATKGTVRDRAGADEPSGPIGMAARPAKSAGRKGSR